MSQIKFQVLDIGEIVEGKNSRGDAWYRRELQCFVAKKVGVLPYYADRAVLEKLEAGYYLADLEPSAGDRGRLEFRLGNLQAVGNIAPAAQPTQGTKS